MTHTAQTITNRAATDDTIYYIDPVENTISIAGFRALAADRGFILSNIFGTVGAGLEALTPISGSLLQEYTGYTTEFITAGSTNWERYGTNWAYRIAGNTGRVISVYSTLGLTCIDVVYSAGDILIVSAWKQDLVVTIANSENTIAEAFDADDWTSVDDYYQLTLTSAATYLGVYRENRSVWCDMEISGSGVTLQSLDAFAGYAVFCDPGCFTEKAYLATDLWTETEGKASLILSGITSGMYRLRNAADGLTAPGTGIDREMMQRWEDYTVDMWNIMFSGSLEARKFYTRIAVDDDRYYFANYENLFYLTHSPSEIIQQGTQLNAAWFTPIFTRVNGLMLEIFGETTEFSVTDRNVVRDGIYLITIIDGDTVQLTHSPGNVIAEGTLLDAEFLQAIENAITRLANEVLL